MKTKIIYYVIIISFLASGNLFSQPSPNSTEKSNNNTEKKTEQPTAPNQPIEFPSMTVEGKEQLKVQSGSKQYPVKIQKLTAGELDSISPVHKQQALLMPPKPLISKIESREYKNNYLNVYAGNFLTFNADAGLNLDIKDFILNLEAHTLYTGGHVDNADAFDGGVNLNLSYTAPRKYYIFGGSKTVFNVLFNTNTYNMYAMDTAFGRNALDIRVGVKNDGEFSGFLFSTGAAYDIFNFEHNNDVAENSDISGYLNINKQIDSNMQIGGRGRVRFGTASGNPDNFMSFTAGTKFKMESLIFDLVAGFESTGSTDKIQRINFALAGNINYLISKLFTLEAGMNMNFDDNNTKSAWMINKFINHKSKIDFPYESAVKAALIIHPNEFIMWSVGAKLSRIDRFRYFVIDSEKIFNTEYSDANGAGVFAKGSLLLQRIGNLSAEIEYQPLKFTNSNVNGNFIPNVSPINIYFVYDNMWIEKIGTKLELNYIGKRYTNIENTEEKSAFINLSTKISYKLMDNLSVYLKGDNLLNSNMYFWGPYRERDLFFSVGAFWQF